MLRRTKQREVILDILKESRNHPSAEEIYIKAKMFMPKISLSTIYRALKSLVNEGKIIEIKLQGENYSRYDYPLKEHQHFYCKKCKKIFDIDISLDVNFEFLHKVEEFRALFIGICQDCLKGGYYEKV